MIRIVDDALLTHLEVTLAVAPAPTLAALHADDLRVQRRARLDLAQHLAERLTGLEMLEGRGTASGQPGLFPPDLWPIGEALV